MKIDQMHYNFNLELDRIASSDNYDIKPWEIDEYLNKAIWYFLKDRYQIDPRNKRGFETDQERISALSSLHIKSPQVQPGIEPIDLGNGLYEVRLNQLGDNINGQYFRYLFLTDGYIKARKEDCSKYISMKQWQVDDDTTIYSDSSWKWRRVLVNFGKSTYSHPHSDNSADNVDGTEADFTANLLPDTDYKDDELSSLFFDTNNVYFNQEFEIDEVFLSYVKYPNRVFVGGYDHIDGLSTADSDPIHCDIEPAFHDEIVRIAVMLAMEDIQDQLGIKISNTKVTKDKI